MEWLFKDYSKPAFDSDPMIVKTKFRRFANHDCRDNQMIVVWQSIHFIFFTHGRVIFQFPDFFSGKSPQEDPEIWWWNHGWSVLILPIHWSMHPAQRDTPGYQPESTHPWDAVASSSPWAAGGNPHWQSQLEVEIGFSDLRDIAFLPPVGLKLGKLNVFFLFRFYVVTLTVEQMKA